MKVVTFTFAAAGRDIRAVVNNRGSYWFVGRDICLTLGYKNPNVMMRERWPEAVAKHELIKDRMGRDQEVRVLTEQESLEMVRRAKFPVPGFEAWLTNEVCPKLNELLNQQRKGRKS